MSVEYVVQWFLYVEWLFLFVAFLVAVLIYLSSDFENIKVRVVRPVWYFELISSTFAVLNYIMFILEAFRYVKCFLDHKSCNSLLNCFQVLSISDTAVTKSYLINQILRVFCKWLLLIISVK